jgi:biopolymer transport protein ExbD
VENKFVASLTSFRFEPQDLMASGIPTELDSTLDKQRKRQDLIAKSNSDVNVDPKFLIMADQRTPYITLKRVLSTAALHGFDQPKLVVVVKE